MPTEIRRSQGCTSDKKSSLLHLAVGEHECENDDGDDNDTDNDDDDDNEGIIYDLC